MAKNKNFKINRKCGPQGILACDVEIGDMFERQGSLHMRVNECQLPQQPNMITICNLNTGSVWDVKDTETFVVISDCEIRYNIPE